MNGFLRCCEGWPKRVGRFVAGWPLCLLLGISFPGRAHAALAAAEIRSSYVLPPTSLLKLGSQPFTTNDLARAQINGLKYTDLPSLGSGLARASKAEFYGISDRGPNGTVDNRRTFPLPQFCPHITHFRLRDGRIEILKSILLTDAVGKPLSGLSNQSPEERLYESTKTGTPLPYDPNGVDPEAIRVFPNGRFLISEEYAPSILVVETNGQVLVRYTPQPKALAGASYPVYSILPAVFAQRRDNRGFESLALSPDGQTAYAILQSPAGLETDPQLANSRVARALRLDLADPLHARVTGHFLVPLSRAADYGKGQKQQNVKLNDAEWLAPDKLLVLESGKEFARLVLVDFAAATNLLGRDDENSLTLEPAGSDLATLSVKPAAVSIWFSTADLRGLSRKLEGLAVLSPTEIALSNDNDYGLGENDTGEPSMVWLLHLSNPLPLAGK